jgi:lycopene cyclase domain-containing protein
MSLYLFLNIASFFIPFLYSFEKEMHFIEHWRAVFLSIILVAVPFIAWDIIFTDRGVWGFNPDYHLNLQIFGLPLEEILFFICIPYASIFTHYALIHYFGKVALPSKLVKVISISLFIIFAICTLFAYPKLYTTVNFILFLILILYSLILKENHLSRFYITFLIILLPFFLVNGILTGSFIEGEVVWYDNDENLGVRLGSIPIEDIIYAFNLIYLNLILIERLKPVFRNKRTLVVD